MNICMRHYSSDALFNSGRNSSLGLDLSSLSSKFILTIYFYTLPENILSFKSHVDYPIGFIRSDHKTANCDVFALSNTGTETETFVRSESLVPLKLINKSTLADIQPLVVISIIGSIRTPKSWIDKNSHQLYHIIITHLDTKTS